MNQIKILLVTNWPITNEAGGVSTMVRSLGRALVAQKHRVQLLIPSWESVDVQTADEASFLTHHLRLRHPCDSKVPIKNLLGFLRDFPFAFLNLLRLLRSEAYDVIHLHYASPYHFYFRLARIFGGPPYIVTLHRGETLNFQSSLKCEQKLVNWSLRGAYKVVAVSDWLAGLAQKTFNLIRQVECIHNGYDLSTTAGGKFEGISEICRPMLPGKFFLMVANVSYYKGPDVAIRAWAIVKKEHPNIHLVMVGEPRDYWEISARLIEDLGCKDIVYLVGALPHAEVLRLMDSAMGLVMPSRNEGFGLVILEAGLKKLPVICSRIAPFLEIVEDQRTAITVPVEDPEGVALAVKSLISNPARGKALGEALESVVKQKFSAQRMAQNYIDLYCRACGKSLVAGDS